MQALAVIMILSAAAGFVLHLVETLGNDDVGERIAHFIMASLRVLVIVLLVHAYL